MIPSQIADSLAFLVELRQPVFVEGKPGVGKSRAVKQVARKLGRELRDIRVALLDPVDLRGVPFVTNGRTCWATPDFLPVDGTGILFFDELDRAPMAVQNACLQLCLDRTLGEYTMPDGWSVVAAGNGSTSRGTTKLNEALANRFVHLSYEIDLDDWCKWAVSADIDPMVIAFQRLRGNPWKDARGEQQPGLLHHYDPKSTEKAFPSPRAWEFVSNIRKAAAPAEIRLGLYAGTVGQGAANEFAGFEAMASKAPSIDAIMMNPATARVPTDEPAAMYAVASALARKADCDNFGRMMVYADRMPADWSVCFVKDAIRRVPDLANHDDFVTFAAKNSDII